MLEDETLLIFRNENLQLCVQHAISGMPFSVLDDIEIDTMRIWYANFPRVSSVITRASNCSESSCSPFIFPFATFCMVEGFGLCT